MLLFHDSHADFSHQIINHETSGFVIIFISAHMGRVVVADHMDHMWLLCMIHESKRQL